jgi:hypothetical protein
MPKLKAMDIAVGAGLIAGGVWLFQRVRRRRSIVEAANIESAGSPFAGKTLTVYATGESVGFAVWLEPEFITQVTAADLAESGLFDLTIVAGISDLTDVNRFASKVQEGGVSVTVVEA